MAAYPSYDILLGSSIQEESGIDDQYASTGQQHSRILYSSRYFRFKLLHKLTLTQFNTLSTTYGSGQRDTYTLTYHVESPAVTYSVIFTEPPQIRDNLGNGQFIVEANLRGTKD